MQYNYSALNEADIYEAYTKSTDEKPVLTLILDLAEGGTVLFPYSYLTPTKITKQKEQYYTLNLIGGGLNLVVHLKNFDEAAYENFLVSLATHKIKRIAQFSGDAGAVNYPVISKIEQVE